MADKLSTDPWQVPANPADLHVFLLMGQSNMGGYGCVHPDDPWQPGDHDPLPRALVMTGQGSKRSSQWWRLPRWRPARHPLHCRQNSSRFGLGLDFARHWLAAHPQASVGLVPCAWGGTAIDELNRGTPIWRNAIRRARRAARDGTIRGLLWHQGESDTANEQLAATYAGKLRSLIADLRDTLAIPELPCILGDFAPALPIIAKTKNPARATRVATVRQALRDIAEGDPQIALVATDGLPSPPGDNVHFNRAALVELGHRYATAMLEVASASRR